MILNVNQIKDIIVKNPQKDLVAQAKRYSKKLRLHFYGEGIDSGLETIKGFEKDALRELRVKYARSNKDLMSRISRPLDKVFSARGTSIYYNLSESQDKVAREFSNNVRSGYSIRKWLENFWMPHFRDDPNGIIYMEIAHEKSAAILQSRGKSIVYPTYKSIFSVYDYLPNGSLLEYVVFNVENAEKAASGFKPEEKIYRVVDDAFDYYVKHEGEDVTILTDHSFPNLFMYVPGILNSDIPDPNREGKMLSFFDEVLELAHHFLLKGSIKLTHEFMHAYPKYWQYADDCPECQGSKYKGGEECKACKGSGKKTMTSVSDVMLLSHPQSNTDPTITPNVAGYVSPDKVYYEIATADLRLLEDLMCYTLWGASSQMQTPGMTTDAGGETKTATQIVSDIKPQSDRLEPVSETAEKRHKFILDALVRIQIDQNYKGASVNYGKRYMIEGPDVLWQKYSDARTKGAAMSVLDDLLMEYYEAKYSSDPVKLAIVTKLMRVEPFVHYTAQQAQSMGLTDLDYYKKVYFSEWLSTLNEAMLLGFSQDLLLTQLDTFANEKLKNKPEPEKKETQPKA